MVVHRWSEEEIAYLREHYPHHKRPQLLEMFNAHFNVNVSAAQLIGTLKRYKIYSGRNGQFQTGQVPFNKGMRGVNFGGENGKKTQFKKGQRPLNYRPVGSERVNIDGYIEMKVADPSKWRLKHNVVWEEVHGPIPKNHCIVFLDKNKLNVTLENLQLVSRSQLVRMNQNNLLSKNPEVTKTGIILADIFNKIGQLKRKED